MEAQRWFFNCPVCGAFKVRDLHVHLDGSLEQVKQVERYYGSPGVTHMIGARPIVPVLYTIERTPTTIEEERKCPCGAQAEADMVAGTISNKHVCDGACTSAHSAKCVCSCGGDNHGAAFMGQPTWFLEFKPKGEKKGQVIEATPEACLQAAEEKAERKEKRTQARREREEAKTQEARADFAAAHPEVMAYLLAELERTDRTDDFLCSLATQFQSNGRLSDRQIEAAERSMERDRQRQEAEARKAQSAEDRARKMESAPALIEGRYPITGRIIKVTWREADWPAGKHHDPSCGCSHYNCDRLGTWKMIVELPDGNRVWMPASAVETLSGEDLAAVGMDEQHRYLGSLAAAKAREGVEIACDKITIKVGDDPHFGFGSRAAGVRLVLPEIREVA